MLTRLLDALTIPYHSPIIEGVPQRRSGVFVLKKNVLLNDGDPHRIFAGTLIFFIPRPCHESVHRVSLSVYPPINTLLFCLRKQTELFK